MEETKEVTVKNKKRPVKAEKPQKPAKDKKKICSIVVFMIGILTLVAGLVFVILNLVKGSDIQDGEYLVSAKQWVLEDGSNCPKESEESEVNCETSQVIWQFTEIGKGKLTTNGHTNDYDFIWAIEDDKLKIETSWLYDLENEYEYSLNQGDGTLTLKENDKEIKFIAEFESETDSESE